MWCESRSELGDFHVKVQEMTERGETPNQEARIADGHDNESGIEGGGSVSRRATLGLLGIGGIGLLTQSTAARTQPTQRGGSISNWTDDVNANGHHLMDLGSVQMSANE